MVSTLTRGFSKTFYTSSLQFLEYLIKTRSKAVAFISLNTFKINTVLPQEVLEITDEAVHITLSSSFVDDVFVVVIPQSAAQFFVVHLGFVFPDAPPSGYFVGVCQLELPTIAGP